MVLSACSSGIDEYEYGYAKAYHQMPSEFERVEIGGTPYWHHGGRYYKQEAGRGYLLVKPPRGHDQVVAASSPVAPPAPDASAAPPPSGPVERRGFSGLLAPSDAKVKRGKPRNVGRSPLRRGRLEYVE